MEQNSPDTDLHKYSQEIFDKGAKQNNGGKIAFQQTPLKQLDTHAKNNNKSRQTLYLSQKCAQNGSQT